MCQGVVSHEICEMVSFSRFRSQKLSSRGNVEKQVTYDNRRPAWMGGVFDVAHAAAIDRDAGCGSCSFSKSCQLDSCHGSDRGERFTTKAERCNRREIVGFANLR